MEISEIIKEARIKKGMTQQELADSVYVTRQTISKWELGKSVPDEASLSLLYQCLEIDNKERNILKKFAGHKQALLLTIIAVVFSPAVIPRIADQQPGGVPLSSGYNFPDNTLHWFRSHIFVSM